MTKAKSTKEPWRIRILRLVWRLIPWLAVAAGILAVVNVGDKVAQKKAKLEADKKAAVKAVVPATRVILMEIEPKTIRDRIELPASVEPLEDLTIKAEVAGQVTKVLAKEGQVVQKDQVIVQLDDRAYRAKLARIEANYRYTQAEFKRMAKLAEKKVTAASKLESTEAQLKDLAAQLNDAKLALEETKIKSPITGRLNKLAAKDGDFLGVGKEVAQVLMFDTVKVTVGVPESDVAAVIDLEKANIIIDALGGRKVTGHKIFLSRQPSSLARLYNLELAVDNKDGRILPGMFARVELVKKVYPHALAVPLYAIITQGEEKYVFVAKDGQAEKRPVMLGVLDGWNVQVIQGLFPGDRVIVVGHRLLDDGQRIDPLKTVTSMKEILAS